MTWNSVAVAPTPPPTSWWNTPPAPVTAQAGTWLSSPLYIMPTGVPSAEAVGVPMVSLSIKPAGIPSAEAIGVPTIRNNPPAIPFPPSRVAIMRASTI